MKNSTRRKFLVLAGVASLAAICASVTTLPTLAADEPTIRIGAILPLSGTLASYGQQMVVGIKLAVNHINADKSLNGKLEIAYEDSQGQPQQGVLAMNKLVNVEKVPFIVGANGGVMKAIAAIAQRSHTVVVNGAAVAPELAKLGEYIWSDLPLLNFEVRTIMPYVINERGLKRLVVIYTDESASQAAREEIESVAALSDAKILASLSVPTSAQQFAGIAAKVRELNPDAVFLASFGTQLVQLVKQLRENAVTQQIVSYSTFPIPEMFKLPAAKGALYTSPAVNYESPDSITQRFVTDYKAANQGGTAPLYTANYYNIVNLFGQIAHQLQKKNKPITGENLLAERLETKSYDLVGGRVAFEQDGTVKAPIQIDQVDENGNVKVVKTEQVTP